VNSINNRIYLVLLLEMKLLTEKVEVLDYKLVRGSEAHAAGMDP